MIRKLAHVCLVTDQLPAIEAFYERLGLFVQFDFRHDDGGKFGCYLGCGDTTFIEVFDNAGRHKQWGGEVRPMAQNGQISHLCLEVTGLVAFRAAMIERGLTLSEIRTGMDGSMQSWTNDPDGNPVELMEYTPDSWQLRRPVSGRL